MTHELHGGALGNSRAVELGGKGCAEGVKVEITSLGISVGDVSVCEVQP